MDPYEFACESTEEGRDIGEGERAYRVEERFGAFAVVEYPADDPADTLVIHVAPSRADAAAFIVSHLREEAEAWAAAEAEAAKDED
jgi:hypothetical protein